MLFRVLKKDMMRKKGINIILFLFIILATIFVASSVNNMITISNATSYFIDKANLPDEFVSGRHIEGNTQIRDWLESEKELVKSYSTQEAIIIGNKNVLYDTGNGDKKVFETTDTIFLEDNLSEYVKIFEENGDPVTVKKGEVAMLAAEAKERGLSVGDTISIDIGTDTKEYRISSLVKDALYVGNMAGMIRFVFQEQDYLELREGSNVNLTDLFYVQTDDMQQFNQIFAKQTFALNPNVVTKDTVSLLYVMDMIVAEMLTAIGICLIIIAVLVLRFTIVFTIQEEYKEIGIMKAIGIRSAGIKQIYLVKYLFIVLVGALIGCVVSFPLGNFMLESVSTKMLMENSSINGIYNILCAMAVVIVVMTLCYLSMRRLNKMSVMESIRSGQTGERYSKKSVLRLGKNRKLHVPFFMALNDILSNIRQYIVLLFVYALGIVLIIIPFNTINTMKSSEMSDQFILDADADAFISNIYNQDGMPIATGQELKEAMDDVGKTLRSKGYDAKVSATSIMFITFSKQGEDSLAPVLTIQAIDSDGAYMPYSKGTAPILENEIALSTKILDELHLCIGDSVDADINGEMKTFIITGTYQDYVQLGKSARLNSAIDMSEHYIFSYWSMPVHLNNNLSKAQNIDNLKADFPDYKFQTAQDIVNSNVGGIIDTIDGMRVWLIVLMSGVNVIITILMMRMFMMREKGEIAMLRSIGFKNRTIRYWQIIRISLILLIALGVAIPLSRLMDVTVLSAIFGIMGAKIKINVIPLQVYVLYPAILLAAIMAAAAYSSIAVKKVDIREINNLE